LLNEIELTVEFRIKKGNMAMGFHQLRDSRLLVNKIQLIKQHPAAATGGNKIHTFEPFTFSIQF